MRIIGGKILASLRERKLFTQKTLAVAVDVSTRTVKGWEAEPFANISPENARKLREALGLSESEFWQAFDPTPTSSESDGTMDQSSAPTADQVTPISDATAVTQLRSTPLPRTTGEGQGPLNIPGVTTADKLTIISKPPNVPHAYDLPVAAGEWAELEEVVLMPVMDQSRGMLIVRIKGDSMEPRFKSGQLVAFQMLDPAEDEPSVGEDHLFIRSGNRATFKTLIKMDGSGYHLKARNPKYKKMLVMPRDEKGAIGTARWIVKDLPEK